MKKILNYGMIMMLLISMSGCATKNENISTINQEQPIELDETTQLFGKVTTIVGNEIEIALANMEEQTQENTEANADEGAQELQGSIAAAPATQVEQGAQIEMPNMDFTGEKVSINVPAGIKIYANGKEISLSNISKGDVLSVIVDNMDALNVKAIDRIG